MTVRYIGEESGKLKIIGRSNPAVNKFKVALWDVQCGWCGIVRTMRGDHFIRLKSCGCMEFELKRQTMITHGEASYRKQTPEHRAWVGMKQRCYNLSNKRYHRYGGRGISVCKVWLNDFIAFLDHIGHRPKQPLGKREWSLDRIDPDGNYEPGNVRWATAKQQARNRGSL